MSSCSRWGTRSTNVAKSKPLLSMRLVPEPCLALASLSALTCAHSLIQLLGIWQNLSWEGALQLGDKKLVLLLERLQQLCTGVEPRDMSWLMFAYTAIMPQNCDQPCTFLQTGDSLTLLSSSAEYSMFLMAISTPKPGSCSLPLFAPSSAQGCAVSMHAASRTGRRT